MSLKFSPQLIGMGDNRTGPQNPPVPYPPNPGDGDSIRGATKPPGLPAGMYGPVPPLTWVDSGIPGIFQRSANMMWEVKPPNPNEIKLEIRVVREEHGMSTAVVNLAEKLRFTQRKIVEDYIVRGPTSLDMETLQQAKLVYIRCSSGEGTMRVDGVALYPLRVVGEAHSTYAFFNYPGGPKSIGFDGECAVDILLFQ